MFARKHRKWGVSMLLFSLMYFHSAKKKIAFFLLYHVKLSVFLLWYFTWWICKQIDVNVRERKNDINWNSLVVLAYQYLWEMYPQVKPLLPKPHRLFIKNFQKVSQSQTEIWEKSYMTDRIHVRISGNFSHANTPRLWTTVNWKLFFKLIFFSHRIQ